MNKKYYLKGNYGAYYALGQGFTANKTGASQLTSCQLNAVAAAGFIGTPIEVVVSFACNYIRQEDLVGDGSIRSNKRNPSKRRFATKDEAIQHGSQFDKRKAAAGDEPGSAGHVGFYVSESSDPVNAVINWKTGLTNPL